MFTSLKKIFASFLAGLILAMPAMAYGDFTTTTVQENSYNASSPVGYFAQYPAGTVVQSASPVYTNGYYGYLPVTDTIMNTMAVPANQTAQVQTQNQPAGTIAMAQPAIYTTTANMPATVQDIRTPQTYNTRTVTTQSTHDGTETSDKVISRAGKVVGIVAVAGLAAALATFLFKR